MTPPQIKSNQSKSSKILSNNITEHHNQMNPMKQQQHQINTAQLKWNQHDSD